MLIYLTWLKGVPKGYICCVHFCFSKKRNCFCIKTFSWFCHCASSGNMLKGSDVPWLRLHSVWYKTLSENIFIFTWQTEGITIFTFCLSVELLCCACLYQYLSHEIKVICNLTKYKGDSLVKILCTWERSFKTWSFAHITSAWGLSNSSLDLKLMPESLNWAVLVLLLLKPRKSLALSIKSDFSLLFA